jgi:hypothetical protein
MKDLIQQIKSDNEDIKLQLDAILNALILPRLGKDKKEIRKKIETQVKGQVSKRIWNAINGSRSLSEIGKIVKRKPQLVLNYMKGWEQTSPPLVYVCKIKENNKIYKRVYEYNVKISKVGKSRTPQKKTEAIETK